MAVFFHVTYLTFIRKENIQASDFVHRISSTIFYPTLYQGSMVLQRQRNDIQWQLSVEPFVKL